MPDGITHRKIYRFFSPLSAVIALVILILSGWYGSVWFLVGYAVHGFGITPDLDLDGVTSDEARWIDSFVLIPLLMWSTMYSRILRKFGGHRGIWTHSPFISSGIRLLWFSFPFVMIFRYYFTDPLVLEFVWMFIGLSFADILHIIADAITGELNFMGRFGGKNLFLKRLMKMFFGYPKEKRG